MILRDRVADIAAIGFVWALLLAPSLGRADPSCSVPKSSTGWHSVRVQSGGQTREVPVYVPQSAVGHSDVALVFDLHGSGGNGREQAAHSGLTTEADTHGFLLANPNGGIPDPARSGESFYWHVPGVPLIGRVQMPPNAPDDVQFFRDAIQQLEQSQCVSPHHVYVTGFSGGARMASALACDLSDQITAIAPVAGLRAGIASASDLNTPDTHTCSPHRAIPILTFHGVRDPTNRFAGDGDTRWGYGIPAALERWKTLDACQGSPSEEKVSTHVVRVRYRGCRDGAELTLYRTDAPVENGGGHIWPHPSGSSPGSAMEQVDQLDASALIWEFFSRH